MFHSSNSFIGLRKVHHFSNQLLNGPPGFGRSKNAPENSLAVDLSYRLNHFHVSGQICLFLRANFENPSQSFEWSKSNSRIIEKREVPLLHSEIGLRRIHLIRPNRN